MAGQFRRGFKAEAERIAKELRAELGLAVRAPLDPAALAEHLCVPVLTLHELRRRAPEHVAYYLGPGRTVFSAATIGVTRYSRVIITNPAHAATRQMNSLCHELGHILLDHEPEAPLDIAGGRQWNGTQEREADWLAGCLLIPHDAAHAAALDGHDDDTVARAFGVSLSLATWRMNETGARLRARRLAKYR